MNSLSMNDQVRVKLTEEGKKVWDEHYKEYEILRLRREKLDKEGYFSEQLWTLFQIFGGDRIHLASDSFILEITL